ncbi:MAG: hypothetical protein II467_06450 [Bacilli bacterium]|nr:hypothetical protein [Bacilli bacterium]
MKHTFCKLLLALSASAILTACGGGSSSSSSPAASSSDSKSAESSVTSSSEQQQGNSYVISVSFNDDSPASAFTPELYMVQSLEYIETKLEIDGNAYTLTKTLRAREQDQKDAINDKLEFSKYMFYFQYVYKGTVSGGNGTYNLALPTSGTKLAYYTQDVHKLYPGKFPFSPTVILPNDRDWSKVETNPVALGEKEFEYSYFGHTYIEKDSSYRAQIAKVADGKITSIADDPNATAVDVKPQGGEGEGGEEEEATMDDAIITLHNEGNDCYLFLREAGAFTFLYQPMKLSEEGTYTYSKNDGFTFKGPEGAVISVSLDNGVYTIDYTAAAGGGRLNDSWVLDKAEADAALASGVTLVTGGFSITFKTGVYTFEFPSYSIKETGTYDFDAEDKLVLTPDEAFSKAVAEVVYGDENVVTISYTAHISSQLKAEFVTDTTVIGELLAEANALTDLVLGESMVLTIKVDKTYTFAYPAYGVNEGGTYAFDNDSKIVFTPNDNCAKAVVTVVYGEEDVEITYQAHISSQLKTSYTVAIEAINAFNI